MDLLDAATIEDPYAVYESLRATGPVEVPGLGFWLVGRYEDCQRVLTDAAAFRNEGSVDHLAALGAGGDAPPVPYEGANVLAMADPPDHTRQRRILNRVFSSRRVAVESDAQIRAVAEQLLDGFADELMDGRVVDLVPRYADPLPTMVIAEVLGVPSEMWATFKDWSEAVVAPLSGTLSAAEVAVCAGKVGDLARWFENDLRQRQADGDKASPGLLSALLHAHEPDDEPLTMAELVSVAVQLLEAGNNTTTHVIGTTLWLLLRDPELLGAALHDPSTIAAVIEEGLRFESPVQGLFRVAAADTEVGGVTIPAGGRVLALFASANRDPGTFPRADHFDASRDNLRKHMGFGWGIHRCVGEHLARAEVRVAVEALLARLPDVRLAPEHAISHQAHFILRGLQALPVHLDSTATTPH